MADARRRLRQLALQRARADHAGQREEPARGMDLLHRRAARTRGAAARRGQHDVPRDAVSQRRVRARSHAAEGQPLKWKFRPENAQAAVGHRVLRRREPRRRVRRRQDRLQPARRAHGRRGRRTPGSSSGARAWATSTTGETITMAPHRREGQSHRRARAAARWACAAGSPRSISTTGKELWRAYNIGPDARHQGRPALQAVLRRTTAAPTSA